MTSTDPATLVGAAVRLATAPGATVPSFLTGLAAVEAAVEAPKELVAKKVEVTGSQREDLDTLADTLAELELPDARRELAPVERKAYGEIVAKVKNVSGLLRKAQDSLRIALFNDLDVALERKGAVGPETPTDNKGFYLLPGEGDGWARSVTQPTFSADAGDLAALVREGLITHKDYLDMTVSVRQTDDGKLLRWIAKNPEKLGAIRRAVRTRRAGSVSLRLTD